MTVVAEDFAFIDRLQAAWETEAEEGRKKLHRERQERQDEQNAHMDRLFSESHITYAEIGAMEEEFQKAEAAKEAKESEREYQSYVQKVFQPAYSALQEQIKSLMTQFVACRNLLEKAAAQPAPPSGSEEDTPPLPEIVDLYLELHRRIELRHEKVLEAILRRDRRYRDSVLRPLRLAGRTAKGREYEAHFVEAEKKTRLGACAARVQREEKALQVLEQRVGKDIKDDMERLGALEAEVKRIGELLVPPASDERLKGDAELRGELEFARAFLQKLAGECEALIQKMHAASMARNAAVYDHSVAVVDLSKGGPDALKKAKEARAQADNREKWEVQSRLQSVRDVLQRAMDPLANILGRA
jgi:hypothetical protein